MQEFDSDLAAYVREELIGDHPRAPLKIPAGISGTDTCVRTVEGQRYDYGRCAWVTERREYKITRKLGIDAIDRGRVPFDVTLALRAPEMSVEDAMIASIDGDDYEFVCNGFYDDWSHDYEQMVRDVLCDHLLFEGEVDYRDATGEDVERDEEPDADALEPMTELVKTSEVKRQRMWERRMLLKRRVRRYARHTGSPKPQKHRIAA